MRLCQFNSPNQQVDKTKRQHELSLPGRETHPLHNQQQSAKHPCGRNYTGDIKEKTASMPKKLTDARRRLRLKTRNYQRLQQEHLEMLQRRQELIRDHEQLRQDHNQTRQELQQLRQERRDPLRDNREIRRQYQKLNQEHQDLQCAHDELKQDCKMIQMERDHLKDELKRKGIHCREDKRILKEIVQQWKERYDRVVAAVILPYAKSLGLDWDDQDLGSMDIVLKPLMQDSVRVRDLKGQVANFPARLQAWQHKAGSLQQQVQDLQQDLLARIEKVQAVSDEQFAKGFRSIVALVKSLSRSVRPDPSSGMFQILDSGILLLNTNMRHWKIRHHRKYYIEAWIWSVLLENIFATPFSMFGQAATVHKTSWEMLYGSTHGGQPPPSSSSELYRCTVTNELVRLAGKDSILSGREEAFIANRPQASFLSESVLVCRSDVASTIGTKLTAISSSVDVSQIQSIIDQSFALALEMSLQKCRLQITYPAIGTSFYNGRMSAMPDANGEDMYDGVVAFIVNPGLTKWGDANGKQLDQCCDIVPSLVQLQAHAEAIGIKTEQQ